MPFRKEALTDVLDGLDSASAPGTMTTKIVAIDGFAGAGKSTLAEAVGRERAGTVLHTDDFASWDEPLEWWPRLLTQVLEPLAANQTGRYQRYDWVSQQLAEWHEIAPGGLLILEGVSSCRAAFRPYLSYSVWVDTPADVRMERGLERDGADARPLWLQWMAEENEWAKNESPKEHVDLVVLGMGK
jgi:uridine kinase